MPAPPQLKDFLIRTPFFGGLKDDALERIMAMLTQRCFFEGATVFKEGDSGRSMYLIEEGDLVVYRNGPSGKAIKMQHMGPGAFFGETTLIEMQPRPNTVRAGTAAVLYELTKANLCTLYQKDAKPLSRSCPTSTASCTATCDAQMDALLSEPMRVMTPARRFAREMRC